MHDAGPGPLGRRDPRARGALRLRPARLARAELRPARRRRWRACRAPAPTGSSRWTRTASTIPRRSGRCWTPRSRTRVAARLRGADQPASARRLPQRREPRRARRRPRSWARATSTHFHSFRLVLGEVGRGLAAYCGESVYLDVALTWVVNRTAACPVRMREERGRPSGYSNRRLASHFWRMVLTSGTRPLRLVALFGALLGLGALVLLGWVLWAKLTDEVAGPGLDVGHGGPARDQRRRSSSRSASSPSTSASRRKSAMGKPLYLVVERPGRRAARPRPRRGCAPVPDASRRRRSCRADR